MKALESKASIRTRLSILAAIAGIGVIYILVCTKKYGAGFSGDSVNYMAAADNLLAGKGFLMCNGEPFIAWPPLYPTLLAVLKFCGLDYIAATRCISALTFGFAMFLAGLWVLKNSGRLLLAILCSVGILLSKPLTYVFCYAWSETIFLVLLMIFFFVLPSVIKDPSIKWILVLALTTAAASLSRYVGGVLVVLVVLLFLVNRKHTFPKRVAFAAFFATVAALPLALWLLRNLLLAGMLTGRRLPTDAPSTMLLKNVTLAGEILASWFLPFQVAKSIPGWLFLCLFFAFIAAMLITAIRRSRRKRQYWLDSPETLLVLFLCVYAAMMVSSAARVIIDPLDDRLLAPLYMPAALLICGAFRNVFSLNMKLIQTNKEAYGKLIRTGILGGICIGVWFATGSNYILNRAERMVKYGAGGRNSIRWHESETVGWLKSNQLTGHVFTSNVGTVYFFSRYTCKGSPVLPSTKRCSSPELRQLSERHVAEFKEAVGSKDGAYLVWFPPGRSDCYNLEQLQDFCRMRMVEKFRDGAIIALYPK